MLGVNQFVLKKPQARGINIAQVYTGSYRIFMKKIIALIITLLMYMLPTATIPAYAANHENTADAATVDADEKKKKKKALEEDDDEEPECD